MSAAARQAPKFPWDYDIPNSPFWNSLEYAVARNILQCFSESEISAMTLDEGLTNDEKLKSLRSILQQTYSKRELEAAPATLHDADYQAWVKLKLAFTTIELKLGNVEGEEKIMREMYDNGPNGTKNMSALHNLSGVMERTGRYAEAEQMADQILPWMQNHEMLGTDSPQYINCLRIHARAAWKQKHYEEADAWIKKASETIEKMADGRFGKYQADERAELEKDVVALKKWREDSELIKSH